MPESPKSSQRIGIVGYAGRGGAYQTAITDCGATLVALCDANADALKTASANLASEVRRYTDYDAMLESGAIDAVIVATPQHLHAAHSIPALGRGISVLSEVPAAVSIAECERLAQAVHEAPPGAIYRIAENYIYWHQNRVVRELARRGLFGQLYYGEGEYLHDVRSLLEKTPWRRKWQMGIDGNTYPTHSLGPLLQWLGPGERVTNVSCAGSGYHHRDAQGRDLHQDTSVMLCKTTSGALLTVRLDLVSDRPPGIGYRLQGTQGAYESGDGHGGADRVWLQAFGEKTEWRDVATLGEEFLSPELRTPSDAARKAGHNGGDYYVVRDFVRALEAVQTKIPVPGDTILLGIHEALDMTLPGLVSQQSIARGGAWLPVADSRTWVNTVSETGQALPQLEMVFPGATVCREPVALTDGYEVRQFRDGDQGGYRTLMNLAGFGVWDDARIAEVRRRLIPGGFFLIEHTPTKQIVATAQSAHAPTERYPEGGEMGWVAAHPDHRGKGLGHIVCSHATQRLQSAGYRSIYLLTDDFRLPAIAIYLALGYKPNPDVTETADRWERVFKQLR